MGQLEWAVTNHLKLSQNLCFRANTSEKESLCLRNSCFWGLAVASGKCLRLWRNFSCVILKSLSYLQECTEESAKSFGHHSPEFPQSAGQTQPTQKASIWPLFPGQRSKGLKVNHLLGVVVYNGLPLTSGAKLHWLCSSYIVHSDWCSRTLP